jgi:hypothetical protein
MAMDPARWRVIRQNARLIKGGPQYGQPMRCKRGGGELYPSGSDGKVIYDTEAAARAAASALELLGMERQSPYPCPRSRHGHYHLTTGDPDRVAARNNHIQRRPR